MLAAKPDDPSSILGARMMEGENQLPQSSADFTHAQALPSMPTMIRLGRFADESRKVGSK